MKEDTVGGALGQHGSAPETDARRSRRVSLSPNSVFGPAYETGHFDRVHAEVCPPKHSSTVRCAIRGPRSASAPPSPPPWTPRKIVFADGWRASVAWPRRGSEVVVAG